MSDSRSIELLPPFMGLPEELHNEGGALTSFYTCVLNHRRMFVFTSHSMRTWFVQVAYGSSNMYSSLENFFYETKGGLIEIPRDPIMLQALLYHLAFSEPDNAHSKEPAATVGTNDSLLALHFKKRGTKSFIKW